MKSRKYIIPILLGVITFFTSCESWLDVNPKTEVKADELFKSERGFRQALYGVYTEMTGSDLYGGNLSMSFLDVLAQNYVINQEGMPFYHASNYEYDVTEGTTNQIWSELYYAIANCNYLLSNIDGKENLFADDNYNVFVAEAKALRAYLHFDLLRMFAPSVLGDDNQAAIPFVDKMQATPFPQLTVTQMLDRVVKELVEAKGLLKDIDPIGPAFAEYEEPEFVPVWQQIVDEGFLLNRKSRMNYYAITGLLARVYLYMGDTEKALLAAKEVIESSKFQFVIEDDLVGTTEPDIIFYNEILFGLYNDNLKGKSDRYFKEDASSELFISEQRKAEYYEYETSGDIDYRGRYQFGRNKNEAKEYVLKYSEVQDYNGKYIPMLRLSEMCYIAAECETDPVKALDYLNAVRTHRGYEEFPADTYVDMDAELYKEYRKEFIAEGQMFYYLKRKNIVDIEYTAIDGSNKIYVLPIPDVEIEFGNIN